MAICISTPELTLPGGVANFVRVLRPHLAPDTVFFEVGSRAGESGALSGTVRMLKDYWRFHRLLGSGTIDVAHLNPSLVPKALVRDTGFLLIAAAHRVPTLVFIHGWSKPVERLISRRLRWLFAAVFRRASAFVVLSQGFKRWLTDMGLQAPISVMTTCVEDAAFEHARQKPGSSRTALLYLGRLDPGKGLLLCLQAFEKLRHSFPEASLTIVGDGSRRQAAEAYVESHSIPGISFLGHLDGAAKYRAYAAADLYVFTSRLDEGMPTTVLEAMAVGLPVVTRAAGGLTDFFIDKKMGRITTSENADELARLLADLARAPDECDRMGDYNHRFARANFSAIAIASKLDEIYGSLRQ